MARERGDSASGFTASRYSTNDTTNPVEIAAKKLISEASSPAVQQSQQVSVQTQQGPPPGSVDYPVPDYEDLTPEARANLPAQETTISNTERAAIIQVYQTKKAEVQRQVGERNRQLDVMGLKDAYSDTTIENDTIYANSLRTGQKVPVGRVRSGPTYSYDDTAGLQNYTFSESPSGVRVYNEESGIMEVGVKGENGRYVPESTLMLEGPAPIITSRTSYNPFRMNTPVTDNYGKLSYRPAWVLPYDTRVIYEPGGKSYDLAVSPTGKKLDFLGTYDPQRKAFIVTSNVSYSSDVDTVGEVLLGRASPVDMEGDLRFYYGESRLDEFAGMAIGPVEKHTYVTVTTPGTAYREGFSVTYDMEALAKAPSDMAGVVANSKINTMPSMGVGELRQGNPIDTGNDPFGPVGWLIPRHAAIRYWLAPETYEPLFSHEIDDPYYKTDEGKKLLDKEIRNYAFLTGMGLVGEAPLGLARGFSLIDDVIMKTPVARDAFIAGRETINPVVRSAAAGLNKISMKPEVRPVYDVSVRGAGIAQKLEPAVTPSLELSTTTSIPKEYTDIVESELLKTEHTVYGGGAAGVQYKYTVPRVSRDIDAFVNNPELVESRITKRIGNSKVEVTDLHAFPEGYPVKGARYTINMEYEGAPKGMMLGTRLLGDPIPKVPRAADIVTGKGLTYERLNYLAVRKYNALYEDIAGIENPLTKPGEVSRLSNRLGKDALDVRLHMTELLEADKASGGNPAIRAGIMADLNKIYSRKVKINIGGVERETTVGELAWEESQKKIRIQKPGNVNDGFININLERHSSSYPGILKSRMGSIIKSTGNVSLVLMSMYDSGSHSGASIKPSKIYGPGSKTSSKVFSPYISNMSSLKHSKIPYEITSSRPSKFTSYKSPSTSRTKSSYGSTYGYSIKPQVIIKPPVWSDSIIPADKHDKRYKGLKLKSKRSDWEWQGINAAGFMDFGLPFKSKKGRRGHKS